MTERTQREYGMPIAIVIVVLLIAGALYFSPNSTSEINSVATSESNSRDEFRMPDESDHLRGGLDAPIKIVEFSDLECPFCARLHPTLTRIVAENDDVVWAYRHFPLNSHTNAFSAAVASECVAKLGGNDAFWNFVDSAFSEQRNLGNSFYEEFADLSGIDTSEFATCRKDNNIAQDVQRDLDEVIAIGARGTPYVIIITQSGDLVPFSGALSYEQVSTLIDQARLR